MSATLRHFSPTASVSSISPKQLQALRKQGKAIDLIDVRGPAEYRSGHSSGAKLIPLDQLSPETLVEKLQNPRSGLVEPLYLTCHSGFRAQQAAERLQMAGYNNLLVVEGGTQAWENAGLPMQRCGHAMSLERQAQIAIGSLLILKVLFGFTIHQLFFAAIPLIAAGLIVAGATRWCGMTSAMAYLPWNRNLNCFEKTMA